MSGTDRSPSLFVVLGCDVRSCSSHLGTMSKCKDLKANGFHEGGTGEEELESLKTLVSSNCFPPEVVLMRKINPYFLTSVS